MLEELSNNFEVVVYTASYQNYADAILDYIDKDKTLVHHRLYREHCIQYQEQLYIKDLRVLGRNLKQVVIVDNAPYAFAAQLDNGYPILPFFDDPQDRELAHVLEYLQLLKDVDDVRPFNSAKFKLQYLASLNIESYARYYHHGADSPKPVPIAAAGPTFEGAATPLPDPETPSELRKLQASLATYFKTDPSES